MELIKLKKKKIRDYVTVEDENGHEKQFAVEALFEMENQTYALLEAEDDSLLMRVENEGEQQYLVGISDYKELESILDAYQLAGEATPIE